MVSLRVAILPSRQDGNTFPDPQTGRPTNEAVQMERLAYQVQAEMQRYPIVIEETIVWGDLYSAGDWRVNLTNQQRAAYEYLNQGIAKGIKLTCALNLHSDGVGWTHVGYYFDGASVDSEATAKALCLPLAPLFGTTKVYSDDYGAKGYYFATEMHQRHRAVLLEIGDHLVQADNLVVATRGEEIAKAIVEALAGHLGIPLVAPPADPWAKWPEMTVELRDALSLGGYQPNLRAKDPYRRDLDGDEVAKCSDGRWVERRRYTGAIKVRTW